MCIRDRLLVVPRFDGAVECLLRLLDGALEHGVHVGLGHLAALVHLNGLKLGVHLAQNVACLLYTSPAGSGG